MKLWYKKEAERFEQALPVGNGRLGAMLYGRTGTDVITVNEDSIWSGPEQDRVNPAARENLDRIRRLILDGKIPEAERLALYALSGVPNSQRSFVPAGECVLRFNGGGSPEDYSRYLDLIDAAAGVTYRCGDTFYVRECFASYPAGVIAVLLSSAGEKKLSLDIHLDRCHNRSNGVRAVPEENMLILSGGGAGGETGFALAAKVCADGGKLSCVGEFIVIEEAETVCVYITAESAFRGEGYETRCAGRLNDAAGKGYDALRREHVADSRRLLGSMTLALGERDAALEALPADERLERVRGGGEDPGLIALYFQYGRYLLFSSSRPGSLPANLQGVWNDRLEPPWDSKYTININTQMNYWPAESCGLSECHMPLFDLLERMKENGKRTAAEMYNCRGSAAHHNTDLYADTAPQDHYIPASYWVMGEAWLALHIIEHYRYTLDADFLREHIDVLAQCVRFFSDFLITLGDGTLAACPSVSPENTYILPDGTMGCLCAGTAMDTEILTDLLGGFVEMCGITGTHGEEAAEAENMLKKLPPLRTGKHGQLMEWLEDYDEAEPGHRHISHLYGVYPSKQISYERTPGLMEAARRSLERRLEHGGGHTGWSRAWIIALWARFRDGNRAYENLLELLRTGTFPNMMDSHPYGSGAVFQIDGNLGACAAVTEMLVQTAGERITLLPALPDGLGSGAAGGLRLPGKLSLDMSWQDGAVRSAELRSDREREVVIVCGGREKTVKLTAGRNKII